MVNGENYTENWDRFNDFHDHANKNPVILLWNNKQYVHKDTGNFELKEMECNEC